jgi:23S rRNA (adenine2503-C2)-methyltransferase
MKGILDLTLEEFKQVMSSWKEKPFRARQIFSWIYKKGVRDFEAMSDLPEALRNKLKEDYYIFVLKPAKTSRSGDGTEKFLLRLRDKNLIEAVVIPAPERVTGCISTQAGCKFACVFCASGLSGFRRNLSAGEMTEEVLYLKNNSSGGKLTHIVFMGTGEPMDNYDNVIKTIRIINSLDTLNIGARRITISTSGIVPGIKRLAQEGLQVELSISLHAADDLTRSLLMPVNRKYPLKALIAACGEYIKKTNRQITFEYVMIKGLNCDLQSAKKLSTILSSVKLSKVNLIPCNSIKGLNLKPPDKLQALFFKDYLLKSGINVTLRKPRGQDIEAACGQLRLVYEEK